MKILFPWDMSSTSQILKPYLYNPPNILINIKKANKGIILSQSFKKILPNCCGFSILFFSSLFSGFIILCTFAIFSA